jgi:phage head maturation protease
MEMDEEVEVLPAQVREDYRKKVAEYTKKFRMACSEFEIDFEEMDTQGSFDKSLLAYLTKRKRLG